MPIVAQSLTGKREFPAATTSSPSPDCALPSCQSPSRLWARYRRSSSSRLRASERGRPGPQPAALGCPWPPLFSKAHGTVLRKEGGFPSVIFVSFWKESYFGAGEGWPTLGVSVVLPAAPARAAERGGAQLPGRRNPWAPPGGGDLSSPKEAGAVGVIFKLSQPFAFQFVLNFVAISKSSFLQQSLCNAVV